MSQEKNEKLIILGHSGSGKDHLRKDMLKFGLRYSPKFTTRPKRLNEKDGDDYIFLDWEQYNILSSNGEIKTSQPFIINENVWIYGITRKNWSENQLFIMTPHELNQLTMEERKGCFVVFLNIDVKVRKERLLERNDNNDSIERRIDADNKDFENFKNYDLCITDPEFETDMIYELMY